MKTLILVVACMSSALTTLAQKQTTYVIVHGAWGGGWAFKEVDSILTAKGHLVYRPTLTGQGERVHLASPDIGLQTHILDVVNAILYERLDNVVLVGHSYGGMVITGVADSIPERIKQLIYLDAFVPEDGESVFTARPSEGEDPERAATDGFIIPEWVDENTPVPHDVPQPVKTFSQPVSHKNIEALSLPATYILTVDEGNQPADDFFSFFAARAEKRGWKIVHFTADHNPQWGKAKELSNLLETVAQ